MTPEERQAILRRHPMWPVFEAYYANRRRRRWPWLVAAVLALAVACWGLTA